MRLHCPADLPKPVIAAVEGYALGGGLEIALCCDMILCAEGSELSLPEGRLGLSPGGGSSSRQRVSCTKGQRVWKRQAAGGLAGLGRSP